jgi:DNA-binding LytR/AlgR family response regulator
MKLPIVTALIADDEAPLRHYLKRQLNKLWPQLSIIAEATNGLDALEAIKQHKPDIVFLDIRMPGLTGLQVAEQADTDSRIVFVTAFDHYAIEAFDKAAVDYLLKPVTDERLQTSVERLQKHMGNTPPDLTQLLQNLSRQLQPAEDRLEWLKVGRQDEITLLPIDEVDYFHATDKYTSVFSGGREWVIRTTLKELESKLDPHQFTRIHRSTIVRLESITRITRDIAGRYWIELQAYTKSLQVSRSYAGQFKQS